MKKSLNMCLVKNCPNAKSEGQGIDIGALWICRPCWNFLLKPEQTTNAVFQNGVRLIRILQDRQMNLLDTLAKTERDKRDA